MTRSARLSCIHLLSLMHVSKGLAESLGKSDYVELAEDYAENTSVVDVTEKRWQRRELLRLRKQHLEKWMTKNIAG